MANHPDNVLPANVVRKREPRLTPRGAPPIMQQIQGTPKRVAGPNINQVVSNARKER